MPYPLDAGPKMRAYYVLRWLAQRHQVTLLSFERPSDPPEARRHLEEFCERVITVPMRRSRLRDFWFALLTLLTGESFIIRRDFVPEMARKIAAELAESPYDVIHADQLWMAQYALRAKKQALKTRAVLDEHNACFQVFQRLAKSSMNPVARLFWEREWRALQRFEVRACAQFDQVVTVTPEDQSILTDLVDLQVPDSKRKPFLTIPICMDADVKQGAYSDSHTLLFVGGMHWPPNAEGMRWFVRCVWPLVRAAVPNATLSVIGKSPPAEVVDQPGVSAPGFILDVEPYWAQSRVFIVPLLAGGGMRVKILDAWAHGLPVVSTSIGAEGLLYTDGEDIALADEPETFAENIVEVLQSEVTAHRLATRGWETVHRQYHWETVYPAWEQVYQV